MYILIVFFVDVKNRSSADRNIDELTLHASFRLFIRNFIRRILFETMQTSAAVSRLLILHA